jgi:hypothetical protein
LYELAYGSNDWSLPSDAYAPVAVVVVLFVVDLDDFFWPFTPFTPFTPLRPCSRSRRLPRVAAPLLCFPFRFLK